MCADLMFSLQIIRPRKTKSRAASTAASSSASTNPSQRRAPSSDVVQPQQQQQPSVQLSVSVKQYQKQKPAMVSHSTLQQQVYTGSVLVFELVLTRCLLCLCDSFRRLRTHSPPTQLQRYLLLLCKRQVALPPKQMHAFSVLGVKACSSLTAACRARLALRSHFLHHFHSLRALCQRKQQLQLGHSACVRCAFPFLMFVSSFDACLNDHVTLVSGPELYVSLVVFLPEYYRFQLPLSSKARLVCLLSLPPLYSTRSRINSLAPMW